MNVQRTKSICTIQVSKKTMNYFKVRETLYNETATEQHRDRFALLDSITKPHDSRSFSQGFSLLLSAAHESQELECSHALCLS